METEKSQTPQDVKSKLIQQYAKLLLQLRQTHRRRKLVMVVHITLWFNLYASPFWLVGCNTLNYSIHDEYNLGTVVLSLCTFMIGIVIGAFMIQTTSAYKKFIKLIELDFSEEPELKALRENILTIYNQIVIDYAKA